MRKQIYLYLLLSMAGLVIAPAFAASSSSSSLDALSIYSLSINPNPVYAGDNITINLQLYDTFSATLQNVNLELEGSYPILNVSPSNPYLISSIGQGLYGGVGSYFTYTIRIPKNTPSGNYTLDLVADYQTTETISGSSETVTAESVMPITFYVHGTPQITINPTITKVSPGNVSTVTLSVMNSGYGTVRNMTVSTLNATDFSVTGTKTFSIGSLASGASTSLTTTYLVNSHITNGTYSIPIRVAYQSDEGTTYSQNINQTIAVKIQNPNIIATVTAASPATLYMGYNQTLTLSIQNIGYGNANNVSVDIASLNGVNILSSVRHFFIGSLAAGQSVTETVLITANNYSGSQASLSAELKYYTSNYQSQFSKNQSINISVAQSPIFSVATGKYSLQPGATSVPINLTITNTGNIDAQQVQLSFQSSYPITPVSGSGYIQDLKPGQSKSVTFLVSVDSHGAPGTYPITVYESWKQPNGAVQQTYSGSSNYYAAVGSTASGSTPSTITDIVVLVIVAIAVLFVYRKIQKSKESKKKTPKAL